MALRRDEPTDFAWSAIEPLLPNRPRGAPRLDGRRVLNGIYARRRTGSPRPEMLAQNPPLGDHPEPVGVDVQADRPVAEGCEGTVAPVGPRKP